ncbi:MAG: 2-amino-4-hydroxy-6-hydroxymethyldihydropteridine diphosphokinase [Solirubrobacteraceae bacterium]|nr:2-amino-4-hydroxy-6-hydroxymethyldihydropteridine diphosphokinase [Solirubrobacteraceae bacterium]
MTTGYLGLGSNVGDRRGHLEAAVAGLRARGIEVLASSSLYDTDPVGEILDQPAFLNACLRIDSDLEPEALLDVAKAIELERGRAAAAPRHAPRPLDVDLLLFGDASYRSERLALPHPQVAERRFVLIPLVELDPELTLPGGRRVADRLAELPVDEGVRWAGPPLALAA